MNTNSSVTRSVSTAKETSSTVTCSTCGAPGTATFVLKKCACRTTRYCYTKCQKKHRKIHAQECRRLIAEKKAKKKEQKKSKTVVENDGATEHVDDMEDKNNNEEGDECPICLENLPKDVSKFVRWTCCGNGSIKTWQV